MINEWDLTQTNQKRIMNNKPNVAILGTSAIEAHNYHLPEGQDFLHTDAIVKRVTKESWDKTKSVICLPTLPYGVDCNLIDFPLTIHVKQSTLDLMITEIVSSLVHHDIKKILLINGHGGNDFNPLVRQIQSELDVHMFWCNFYEIKDKDNKIFDKTSFLEGNNSAFIEELYLKYINNPEDVPQSWREFFDGLNEDQKIIQTQILGPSWSPQKKNISKIINKVEISAEDKLIKKKLLYILG